MTDRSPEARLRQLKRYRPELTSFYPLPHGIWTQMVSTDGQSSIRAADDQWIRASDVETLLTEEAATRPAQQEKHEDDQSRVDGERLSERTGSTASSERG